MDNTNLKNITYDEILKKYQILPNSSYINDSIFSDVLVELLGGKGKKKPGKKMKKLKDIDQIEDLEDLEED